MVAVPIEAALVAQGLVVVVLAPHRALLHFAVGTEAPCRGATGGGGVAIDDDDDDDSSDDDVESGSDGIVEDADDDVDDDVDDVVEAERCCCW